MLKYQVQTLNRERRKPRKSTVHLNQIFSADESWSSSGNSTDHGGSSVFSVPNSPGPSSASTASASSKGSSSCGSARHHRLRRHHRSTSVSSLSSTSSSSDLHQEWGTIRIYTGALHAESDYKTLYVTVATTAEQLVQEVLSKFRSRHRDPNLFYLNMEIFTKHEGTIVTTRLPLDPRSKPLELQSYHPKDKCRFVLALRRGAPVKIYDRCINGDSVYKSILVSERTSCAEAVQLLLQMHKLDLEASLFRLFAVDVLTGGEQILDQDLPLLSVVQQQWWDENCQLHLRHLPKKREGRTVLHIPVDWPTSLTRKPSFHDSLCKLTQKLNSYCIL